MIFNGIGWFDRLAGGGYLNSLLTIIAGASMVGAFAPFGYWFLIFPGLIWFILPLQTLSVKQTFYRGLWFNIGFYGAGVSWVHVSIHRFGNAPLPLSVTLTIGFIVLLSLFCTLTVVFLNRYFPRHSTKQYFLVSLPLVWILFEWIKSWFATGFPWLDLGYSQIDSPLSAIAPLLGNASVSFLIIFLAGLTAVVIREGVRCGKFSAIVFLLVAILLATLKQIIWVIPTDKTVTVSLIQPNIPQEEKWRPEQRGKTLRYFQQTSRQ